MNPKPGTSRWSRRAVVGAALAVGAWGLTLPASAAATQDTQQTYIVAFKGVPASGVDAAAAGLARAHGGQVGFTYRHALQGFSITASAAAADGIRRNPNVASVELSGTRTVAETTQPSPPSWGLDRVDQADLPLSTTYVYNCTGAGVDAYIIDSGIRRTHGDFTGRALTGYDAITSGGTATDGNGHGTHVAGIVGGAKYGIAKGVTLYAVRVLDNNGSGTDVRGHLRRRLGDRPSLATPRAPRWRTCPWAVRPTAALDAVDATRSPAASRTALPPETTIPTRGPTRPPGCRRASPWPRRPRSDTCLVLQLRECRRHPGPRRRRVKRHRLGLVLLQHRRGHQVRHIDGDAARGGRSALYLQANPTATPAQVGQWLADNATPNVVTGAGTGSPNRLLHTRLVAPPPPPPAAVTQATITGTRTLAKRNWTATGTTVTAFDGGAAVDGATVTVRVSGGATGTKTCTTGTAGTCSVSATVKNGATSVTFTVTNVVKSGTTWNGTAASVTVTK